MRHPLAAFVLCLSALPALAKGAEPALAPPDPVVGNWLSKEPLGDGATFGFELHSGGSAKAVNTATMRVERWRRVDATHIELTEVSEGNGSKSVDRVRYTVVFGKDGSMTLKDGQCQGQEGGGMYDGTYLPAKGK